jgi:hypothetical protein
MRLDMAVGAAGVWMVESGGESSTNRLPKIPQNFHFSVFAQFFGPKFRIFRDCAVFVDLNLLVFDIPQYQSISIRQKYSHYIHSKSNLFYHQLLKNITLLLFLSEHSPK